MPTLRSQLNGIVDHSEYCCRGVGHFRCGKAGLRPYGRENGLPRTLQEPAFECDEVMRGHLIAKTNALRAPSEESIKGLSAAEVALLSCHDYDKLRKRLQTLGLSEGELASLGIEAIEEKAKDVRTFVETHEIRDTRRLLFAGIVTSALWAWSAFGAEKAFVEILRSHVREGGFQPSVTLYRNPDERLVAIGKAIFESKGLSLNGNISCQTCHLVKFGSSDGIPLAAAIGGKGEGPQRLLKRSKAIAP